jgi:hypothetical protein
MLLTEVEHRLFRTQKYNEQQAEESRLTDLDQLEELRDATIMQLVPSGNEMFPLSEH